MDRIALADLRRSYTLRGLERHDLHDDPIHQFERWLADAVRHGLLEPNAMALATAAADGMPSVRTVLLKGLDARGFVFYTNYASRKGREIDVNPRAALLFAWLELERQVRVQGRVERVSREESEAYFRSRPRGSRIGAWASEQSEPVDDREALEARVRELEARFPGEVPLPPSWGGYRVVPQRMEFWQGRENRLHDRFEYFPDDAGAWSVRRLSP